MLRTWRKSVTGCTFMGQPPGKHVLLGGRIKPIIENGTGAPVKWTTLDIPLKSIDFLWNPSPKPLLHKKAALALPPVVAHPEIKKPRRLHDVAGWKPPRSNSGQDDPVAGEVRSVIDM
ncbi:hypothetical protein [Solidesulfovibrio fructosivorans]|uniref:hypothetical protein n=1 Tax=Solidesulfovibrio fructosivorans TaxID=878 RepID=UPI0013050A10|nr:hypothetical protein [Solidesulfovibrio fructosivorans]